MRGQGMIDAERLADPGKIFGTMWVLRPEDRVLFQFTKDIDNDEVEEFARIVKHRWPDVPCVFMVGDVEVTVISRPPPVPVR